MKKILLLSLTVTAVMTGCTTFKTIQVPLNSDGNAHQRINTTQCKDADDWYLDGYRVGKSFLNQKTKMLKDRMEHCQFTEETLPQKYKANWEIGFEVGNRR